MKTLEKRQIKNAMVLVYRRWSTDVQGYGDSGRRQTDRAQRWCDENGLTITYEETADGVSAYRGKNRVKGSPLDRLINRIKPPCFFLVEDHDRLTRQDWLEGMNLVADIVGRGATLVTLDNNNLIDAERFRKDPGCFLPAILRAHTGHDEDNKKAKRVQEAWEARRAGLAKGKPANLHLPAWLYWDYEAEQPKLDPHNAPIVRKMFALALEGLGCQTIARKLHEAGERLIITGKRKNGTTRSRKSRPGEPYTLTLSQPYVWRTLQNKLCIGHGVYTEPPKPGVYPAVVTEEVFFAVQKLLKHNHHQTVARASSTSSLFTGIARCSRCDGTLCRFSQRRNGKRYEYLVCSDTLHKHGKCGMASIRYDAFEKSFLQLLAQSDLMRQAISAGKPAGPSPLDSLNGQLADAENMAIKLLNLVRKDPDPPTTLLQAIKDEEARAADLRQRIEDERGMLKAETPGLEEYQEFCDRFGGRMEQQKYRAEVKALLRSFVLNVEVKLGQNKYAVMFKGATMPITVTIAKGVWTFYPIPAWALGRELLPNDKEAPVQAGAKGVLGVVRVSPT